MIFYRKTEWMNAFIFWTVHKYMLTYKAKDSWTEVNNKYNKYTGQKCPKESEVIIKQMAYKNTVMNYDGNEFPLQWNSVLMCVEAIISGYMNTISCLFIHN